MAEKKKTSISEELGELALKNSDSSKEIDKMKRIVNCSRRRKCKGASSIDPKEKRNGKIKKFSDLEVAVENILHRTEEVRDLGSPIFSLTDLILDAIISWPTLADELEQRGLISSDLIFDEKGQLRFAVPWLNELLPIKYRKEIEKLFGRESSQITVKDLRKNTSSLVSQIFKVFSLLDLASRETIGRKTNAYHFDPRLHGFSLAQMRYILEKGRDLQRKVDRGEIQLKEPKAKRNTEERGNDKKMVEVLAMNSGSTITKRTVEVLPDGKVIITSWFK